MTGLTSCSGFEVVDVFSQMLVLFGVGGFFRASTGCLSGGSVHFATLELWVAGEYKIDFPSFCLVILSFPIFHPEPNKGTENIVIKATHIKLFAFI